MLEEKIKKDLNLAMKERREFEVGVFRLLVSALHNQLIEKRAKGSVEALTDDEVVAVLKREVKKRKEAAELFQKGGREELKEKELKEAEIISGYLPQELGKEEIRRVVAKIVKAGGKNFGEAMKEAMKELKGQADGKEVSEILKELLG